MMEEVKKKIEEIMDMGIKKDFTPEQLLALSYFYVNIKNSLEISTGDKFKKQEEKQYAKIIKAVEGITNKSPSPKTGDEK